MQIARELQPQSASVVSRASYKLHTRAPLRAVPQPALRKCPAFPTPNATRAEFERAVLPHRAALAASARRLAKSRSDADDLVQETLLRAWRFWPRYHERDHCRAWLQRILSNTFCSMCRSAARRRAQLSQLALASSMDAELASKESALESRDDSASCGDDQLASSLAALKPEQRRILCLIDLNERSYREAANELACPIGTVMSRLHRARRALRAQLDAAAVRA
jgi:RNA polymerase sigma-70 factor (ECF subfamily)